MAKLRFAEPVVYRGREHPAMRGQEGILLEVLSPGRLLVALALPDGRRPVLEVAPQDVGVSEEEAARFLAPVRWA